MMVEDINSLFLPPETFLSGWEVYQAKEPEGKNVTQKMKQRQNQALDGASLH